MGKRLKIAVVGLPLFGKRYAEHLNKFQFENCSAQYFNSFYKKADKLKLFLKLKNFDVLVSINGTLNDSKAFDLAIKNKIPIVMNWVGSDVLEARKAININEYRQDYIGYATHLCEVDWIKTELKELGIEAKVLNFLHFNSEQVAEPFDRKNLKVISYINRNNPSFYGLDKLKWIASQLPEIQFTVAGYEESNTNNINYHGWVDDLPSLVNKHQLVFRFTDHDGLSNMVLESLYLKRIVLYNNPLENCIFVKTKEEAKEYLEQLDVNDLDLNSRGKRFVEDKFSHDKIYKAQLKLLNEVVNG